MTTRYRNSVHFLCSLCGVAETHRSTQKGVGQGWRRSAFMIHLDHIWFCPAHTTIGRELEQTIEFSVENLKTDIVASVRNRVLQSIIPPRHTQDPPP